MNEWRNDPATEAQKRRLNEERIKYHKNITKGEASDLIGNSIGPNDYEKEILKFFMVGDVSRMSHADAKRKIEEIFSEPENKEKWEQQCPPSKRQKEIYKFFNIIIPRGLRYKDAYKFINELFEDESKLEKWEKHKDEVDERESWFEDNYEMMNDDREWYNCKKISNKLFKQVVESLEASGMSLNQIEQNEEAFFRKAIEIEPSIRLVSSSNTTRKNVRGRRKKSNKGLVWLIIIIIIILIMIWLMKD